MVRVVMPGDGWEEEDILPHPHTYLYRSSDALLEYHVMYLKWGNINLKSDLLGSDIVIEEGVVPPPPGSYSSRPSGPMGE